MIHRAPFGSMERFVGVLIEHFAGAFPLWLAPEQARILPISEKFNDYAEKVAAELRAAGLRITVDIGNEKVGAKIRKATTGKVPYMLIVGEQEQEAHTVALRHRTAGDAGTLPTAEAAAKLKTEINERQLTPVKPELAVE
jgi:threonyl-tRNA synthetase